jgi:curved DNA-binding protein CbpA
MTLAIILSFPWFALARIGKGTTGMTKDYYQILGVPRKATGEQIKKAYRKLAMQHHPDRNLGREKWANEKFKEINEAFSVLGDPAKRKQYDQFGTVGNVGDIFGSPSTRTTFEGLVRELVAGGKPDLGPSGELIWKKYLVRLNVPHRWMFVTK